MMEINTHTLTPGNITVVNNTLNSDSVSGKTVNYSNYDDTYIRQQLATVQNDVDDVQQDVVVLQQTDVELENKITMVELHVTYVQANIEQELSSYATKVELEDVSETVTSLETTPIGIQTEQLDELFPII